MKLFTIGDSLSQGFMSGAAARVSDSYSTLIAGALGLAVHGSDYRFPDWPHGGLPVNLEAVLRRLSRVYGADIQGGEWLGVPFTVNSVLDRAEDYYERGDGSEDSPYRAPHRFGGYEPLFFHNVASFGFDIADSWLINGKLCLSEISRSEDVWFEDAFLGPPSASFYRSALRTLNPSLSSSHEDKSQIDWLEEHAKAKDSNGDSGVENLILWLGNNNALGTALHLRISETGNDSKHRPSVMSHQERKKAGWTLWHPEDFHDEYESLINRVVSIIEIHGSPQRVFVGNIPHVTIIPLIKGIGDPEKSGKRGVYFPAYTYFPFDQKFAKRSGRFLTGEEAQKIDMYIDEYNRSISDIVDAANKALNDKGRSAKFCVVDINQMLATAAYKRNNGKPTYRFPKYVKDLHGELAKYDRLLSTHYYHVNRDGVFQRGGFFSLDGVHPSVLGQGLIAYEFLSTMKEQGVKDSNGKAVSSDRLQWSEIYKRDTLLTKPIDVMEEIYEHEDIVSFVAQVINTVGNVQPRKLEL